MEDIEHIRVDPREEVPDVLEFDATWETINGQLATWQNSTRPLRYMIS